MIAGKAEAAHCVGKTEPTVKLHRAGVLAVAFGMPAALRLGVEDRAPHAVKVEKQREHETDRPAADDRDRRGRFVGRLHNARACPPEARSGATEGVAAADRACIRGSRVSAIVTTMTKLAATKNQPSAA